MYAKIFTNLLFQLPIFLFLIIAAITASAAPGNLDTTFNGTGKARVGFGFGSEQGRALAVQSDGKSVVAGNGNGGFLVARFNVNGTLDTTFGNAGSVNTIMADRSEAKAVQIQTDGKIVVAGNNSAGLIALVRYNANGTLDTSFGNGGISIPDISGGSKQVSAMVILSDGKILVAGQDSYFYLFVARFNSNGTLDGGFNNSSGLAITQIENYETTANALAVQPDGKIVAAGHYIVSGVFCGDVQAPGRYGLAIVRFDSEGRLDSSFDGDGKVQTFDFNNNIRSAAAVAIQYTPPRTPFPAVTKIVVAGSSSRAADPCSYPSTSATYKNTLVARYNSNGTLDTSFSGDGITENAFGSFDDTASSAAIISTRNPDTGAVTPSRIVIAGFVGNEFMVAKYLIDGTLDTAFDGDGLVTTSVSAGDDVGNAMRIVFGDRILVAGTASNDFGLARYDLSNGSLDTTFDADGKATADLSDGAATGRSVAIQPDGKIVVAGFIANVFCIARFNSDGTLDASFDADGKVTTSFGGGAYAIAIQPDGKIVAVGTNHPFGGFFAVARYNSDGSLDTSFDTDGKVITPVGSGSAVARGVAIQPDGGIVVAGYAFSGGNEVFAVVRYNLNGMLDTNFGYNGRVLTPIRNSGDRAYSMTLQPDGAILAAGYAFIGFNTDFALARYNPNGSLDTNFSFGGTPVTFISGGNDYATAVKLQTDGKIVLAGASYNGSNYDFALVRYNSNGTLDTSFDADGKLTTAVGDGNDYGNALAIQTDGRILVAGTSYNGTNADFAVVRYNPDGSLDNSYGASGKIRIDVSDGGNDFGNAIALDSAGNAIVAGEANGLFGVVRLLGSGALTVSISGVVGYGTSTTPKFVSGVTLSTAGAFATSLSNGSYLLDNLTNEVNYTVTPTKTGNVNGISALDATMVLRYVASGGAGQNALTPNQLIAADANGSINVTALDATMILRYVASGGQSSVSTGQTGNWKFSPVKKEYLPLNETKTGENYQAILVGEVNGSWIAP